MSREIYLNMFREKLYEHYQENVFGEKTDFFSKIEHSIELATETYLDLTKKGIPPEEALDKSQTILIYDHIMQ